MPLFSDRKSAAPDHMPPPSLPLLALELRAPWEFAAVLPAWPVLQRAPLGDGHTVIVFPGLTAGDTTTLPLRRYLESRNYNTLGWGQGLNLGPREGVLENAKAQLQQAANASGNKVSLVGWSLGGIYARELAKEMPDLVRCVITLGTPFTGHPMATNAWRFYQLASGQHPHDEDLLAEVRKPPPVPTTSIFTRTDGIVGWGCCIEKKGPLTDNIEIVGATHTGLGVHPLVLYAVGDRLAQPEAQWSHFAPRGPERVLYPSHTPGRDPAGD